MAKDAWSRFREKEEQRDEDDRKRIHQDMKKIDPTAEISEGSTSDKMMIDLLAKCEVLMEQISSLYQMWIQGMERLPPLVQRKHLEDMVLKIQAAPKPSANLKFRVSQFQTRYSMFKDKWERLIRDVEMGKIVVKRRGT